MATETLIPMTDIRTVADLQAMLGYCEDDTAIEPRSTLCVRARLIRRTLTDGSTADELELSA